MHQRPRVILIIENWVKHIPCSKFPPLLLLAFFDTWAFRCKLDHTVDSSTQGTLIFAIFHLWGIFFHLFFYDFLLWFFLSFMRDNLGKFSHCPLFDLKTPRWATPSWMLPVRECVPRRRIGAFRGGDSPRRPECEKKWLVDKVARIEHQLTRFSEFREPDSFYSQIPWWVSHDLRKGISRTRIEERDLNGELARAVRPEELAVHAAGRGAHCHDAALWQMTLAFDICHISHCYYASVESMIDSW